MNLALVATAVGVVVSLLGLLGGIVKIGMKYQEILSRVEQNEKRDEEERKENALKFNELYTSRNKTNEALVEVNTTLKMMIQSMDQQFVSLTKKIDELKAEK